MSDKTDYTLRILDDEEILCSLIDAVRARKKHHEKILHRIEQSPSMYNMLGLSRREYIRGKYDAYHSLEESIGSFRKMLV